MMRYLMLCVALVAMQNTWGYVLQQEELMNNWRPKDMTLKEWRDTWGQGYEQHAKVIAKLDQYAYLVAKEHNPDVKPESVKWVRDDLVYTLTQAEQMIAAHSTRNKRGVGIDLDAFPSYRWPNPVPYKVDTMFTEEERGKLMLSVAEWERLTCLRFDLRDIDEDMGSTNHFLITQFETGCYAYVGNIASNPQILHMASSCFSTWGTGAHEIAHTLGMYHEQSRPDRDDHLTVNWDNIEPGKEHNFEMKDPDDVNYETPYDHGSIMHYSAFSFTVDGDIPTLIPNEESLLRTMGQRTEIDFNDAKWMNQMYCADSCSGSSLDCDRAGYANPNDCDNCQCRDGWTGTTCEDMQDGHEGCTPLSGKYELDADTPSVCISTPNYDGTNDGRYDEGDQCTWTVEAPAGCTMGIWSTSNGWLRGSTACWHWVELYYNSGHDNVGHRLCTDDFETHDVDNKLNSDNNQIVALFRSPTIGDQRSDSYYRGFQLCVEITDPACLG